MRICCEGNRLLKVSDRLSFLYAWLSYTAVWEDISAYDNRFDLFQQIRAHASADALIIGPSRARSSFHQISSRISLKLRGVRAGGGIPRASVE